ncbi:MAG: hypothetical protein KAI64_01130, partial [Thermoplasmata archaeon]|nr:hypothetical protein [Thermoplasmata archaeon]
GNSDTATDVKTYDGSWSSQDFQPVYVLQTATPSYEGNPYHSFSEKSIYGTGNAWGNRFTITVDETYNEAKFYLKKVGTPAGDITVKIRNIDDGILMESKTLTSASVGTTYGWVTFTFDTGPEFVTTKSYRIYLESPDSADSSNCYVTPALLTMAAPYQSLSYDGTATRQTQITDTNDPDWDPIDKDRDDIPFQLIPEYHEIVIPVICILAIPIIILRKRKE